MGSDLFLVYGAYILAAGSPGPSNLAIMSAAMEKGRGSAMAMAAGVVTVSFAWGLIAVSGLAALLLRYGQAFIILKAMGGLYLLWLAVRAARSAISARQGVSAIAVAATSKSTQFRRGALMHIGNPKAVLSWLALMSLGVGPNPSTTHLAAAFGGCVLLGTLIFFGYAVLFSTAPMAHGYARNRRWIEGVLALTFAGAGLRLLLSR
ncbi:LysE family translocator [Sphingobium indicum]|uniref:Amino acid transporter n=1 Tax=Sphingobium indicum (strain DSM 16412 / CCM 7286 / MTCC 6364 / B90A) TaxID=861109 RepID=A0A1L5BKM5_SPHIB|nr:LysE family translocator [Sphingobium indicum]APL93409.1 amino acid transporter [Sphingobium indicum B90A]